MLQARAVDARAFEVAHLPGRDDQRDFAVSEIKVGIFQRLFCFRQVERITIEGSDRCFDNNSIADILFEGIKSKTSTRNAGTMNCQGLFQFVFKNSAGSSTTLLQRLSTKKMNQVIFTGNNGKVATVTAGPAEQASFLALLNCLLKEAKTLIK